MHMKKKNVMMLLDSNISRLKFRLPDGSSSIYQFPAEAPLSEVRQYIDQNMTLPFSNYTLASTVQHRPFTASDNSTSLRDLGLVPSAILVILPVSCALRNLSLDII